MDKQEAMRKALEWMRPDAERRIEEARSHVESGNGRAILYAVRICAENELPMPKWLARHFVKRVNVVFDHTSNSWDDAFGIPYPGQHIDSLKLRQQRIPVLMKTNALAKRIGITKALQRVAGDMGMSYSHCRALYYEFPEGVRFPAKRKITGKTSEPT